MGYSCGGHRGRRTLEPPDVIRAYIRQDDLLNYLSCNSDLIVASYNAMKPFKRIMHIKGKKIEFSSFALNFLDAVDNYDQYFFIESREEDTLAQIRQYAPR